MFTRKHHRKAKSYLSCDWGRKSSNPFSPTSCPEIVVHQDARWRCLPSSRKWVRGCPEMTSWVMTISPTCGTTINRRCMRFCLPLLYYFFSSFFTFFFYHVINILPETNKKDVFVNINDVKILVNMCSYWT